MGIILVYDLTNYKSFENISKWLRNIDEHASEDVEKLLLGNKCDVGQGERMVSYEKGREVQSKHAGFLAYILSQQLATSIDF